MHSRTGMALPQPVMKTQQREIPIVINMRLILMDPVMKQDFSPPSTLIPSESGQSTMEFLLAFTFVFSLIFLIFQVGVNFTNGYLVHYATYVASRTYLVIDNNSNTISSGDEDAKGRAISVFNQFPVDKFVPGFRSELKINHPMTIPNNLFVGAWVEYPEKFGISDLIGGIKDVSLRSESFLGREPSRVACLVRICEAMKEVGGTCGDHTTFFDDGC
jgi:hypothetical protein